jgi:hypothetical protein
MKLKNCLILIACISATDASALRGSDHRELATMAICRKVTADTFETHKVSMVSRWRYIFSPDVVTGSCEVICADLCKDYPSFVASIDTCACEEADLKIGIRCGENAELTDDASSCQCLPGYEGDAFTACTETDECASSTDCASNQICANTAGHFTCEPIMSPTHLETPVDPEALVPTPI